jgi:hypothetical protein
MNRNIAFALVLATAAIGNAFAGEITPEPAPFVSTLTRAEVTADYIANRAQVAALNAQASGADAVARNVDVQHPDAIRLAGRSVSAQ